jgi:hypothetical protein
VCPRKHGGDANVPTPCAAFRYVPTPCAAFRYIRSPVRRPDPHIATKPGRAGYEVFTVSVITTDRVTHVPEDHRAALRLGARFRYHVLEQHRDALWLEARLQRLVDVESRCRRIRSKGLARAMLHGRGVNARLCKRSGERVPSGRGCYTLGVGVIGTAPDPHTTFRRCSTAIVSEEQIAVGAVGVAFAVEATSNVGTVYSAPTRFPMSNRAAYEALHIVCQVRAEFAIIAT